MENNGKVNKQNKEELSLTQAVEYFSLTPVQKAIAKRLWSGDEKATIKDWENRFNSKGITKN